MEFHKLTTADKPLIDEYLKGSGLLGSDYNYGSWFSWYDYDAMQLAEEDGVLYIRATLGGEQVFLSPLTRGSWASAVDKIKGYCKQKGLPFKVVFATEEQVKTLKNYTLTTNRDNSEYVYRAEDLISLSGKKYHGKRNHVSKFDSLYNYEFRDYDDALRGEVEVLMDLWIAEKGGIPDDEEKSALFKMLDLRRELNCFADVLIIGGKVVGVSVGEVSASGVGVTLFEKADYNYEGIYSALNRMFCAKHFSGVEYVNRQEDMGIEGLRTAKLSYHPAVLVDKYTVTAPEDEQLRSLYECSFEESKEYIEHFFAEKAPKSSIICERKDGVIMSALYCFERGLIVDGRYVNSAFITAAATLPTERRKGYLAKLMKRALCELYSKGVGVVLLQPFTECFYSRFGFAETEPLTSVTVKYTAKRPLKAVKTTSVQELKKAYDAYTADKCYYLNRTEADFTARLNELAADGGEAHVVYSGKKPVGYLLFAGGAEEAALSDKALSSVKEFDGFTVERGGAELRIVNLCRFIEQLHFKTDFELDFKLTDTLIGCNCGVFRLTAKDGCGRLATAEEYSREFTVAEFASYLLFEVCGTRCGYVADRY